MKMNNQQFDVLRKISKKPSINQRELASELNMESWKIKLCFKRIETKRLN